MIHEGDAQVLPIHLTAGRAVTPTIDRTLRLKDEGIEVIDPLNEMVSGQCNVAG
jgi:hypothetical protein